MGKKSLVSKVDSMLEGMIERLEKIEKFTVDQLPEICKEIIEERKVELQNSMILNGLMLAIVGSISATLVAVTFNPSWGDGRILTGIGGFLATAFSVALLHDLISSGLKLRELNAAPKLFVVNRLRRMIGGK